MDNKAGRANNPEFQTTQPTGVNWLLVIAIDKYQHCAPLNNCVKDAKAITKILTEKYQFQKVEELYDAAANRKNIIAKLNDLQGKIKKDVDNLLIYFSGHGETEGEDGDEDEQIGYLVPVDAARGDESDYLPHSFFKEKLNRIKTRHTFVIMDACFSGSFFIKIKSDKRRGAEHIASRWGFSSSLSHEVALDGKPGDNSPFAQCLLETLQEHNASFGIHGLAEAVGNKMLERSARQTPVCLPFSDPNKYKGQFFFHPAQNEAHAWTTTEATNTAAAFYAFWQKYPDHPNAGEALWRYACKQNEVNAFQLYRNTFFGGKYFETALDKIDDVVFEQAKGIDQLRDYLKRFGENARHSVEAHRFIDELLNEIPLKREKPFILEATTKLSIPGSTTSGNSLHISPKKQNSKYYIRFIFIIFIIGISLVMIPLQLKKYKKEKLETYTGDITSDKIEYAEKDTIINEPITRYSIIESFENNMIFVQGGTLTMGCLEKRDRVCMDNEKPVHIVNINDFYIGKYEITQAEWRTIMGGNPPKLAFKNCDQCPVENVSWNDVKTFIIKLNEQTEKKYRLPTEAEWEYAARGGNISKGFMYAGSSNLEEVGWYSENSYGKIKPVGLKKSNELGIFDMSGNVWEWCEDNWHDNYYDAPNDGSAWLSNSIMRDRVFRGGAWDRDKLYCRIPYRDKPHKFNQNLFIGFRLARD